MYSYFAFQVILCDVKTIELVFTLLHFVKNCIKRNGDIEKNSEKKNAEIKKAKKITLKLKSEKITQKREKNNA